jgi:hypothetical protein
MELQRKLKESRQENGGGGKRKGVKGKGKNGDGGGKGDTISSRSSLPPALFGKASRTPAGEPICYNYNLEHGCAAAKPGERCPKGWHVCMEPGCGKAHTLKMHR